MRKVIAGDEPLVREEWSRDEVRAFFEKQGESFKAEWVMELPEGEAITMYRSGGPTAGWTCAAGRTWPRPASSTRRPSS